MWKVYNMKEIKQVKLGFNKNAEVIVVADIEMKEDSDLDSLFLCFFTILHPPLRLSVITTGCLNDRLSEIYNQDVSSINRLMEENEEMYGAMIQQSTEQLLTFGEEQNKIVLDSVKSAEQASAILASMLKNGFYLQKNPLSLSQQTCSKARAKGGYCPIETCFQSHVGHL